MQTHDWNAVDYSANSQIQQRLARELIAKLALTGSETVLDVGCGDGKITAEMAGAVRNGSVVGVDNSSAMIAFAKQRFPNEEHKNLSFEVMDACELTFENRFNLAFSNAALHWVKDHNPVIEALFKSLKPGGRIVLQMGARGGIDGYLSVVNEIVALPEWAPYFREFVFPFGFMGVEDYHAMLSQSGFSAIRVEYIPKDVIHAGKDPFKGWIRTTWVPYLHCIPDEMKPRFIDLIASRYIEKYPLDEDGNVHVTMGMLEVKAEKPHSR